MRRPGGGRRSRRDGIGTQGRRRVRRRAAPTGLGRRGRARRVSRRRRLGWALRQRVRDPSAIGRHELLLGLLGRSDPAETIRAHWASIAAGDYGSADDTFVSSYSTSRSEWIVVQQDYVPRVASVQATTVSDDGDTAQVEISTMTRDAGRGRRQLQSLLGFGAHGARGWQLAVPTAPTRGRPELLPAQRGRHLRVGPRLRPDLRLTGHAPAEGTRVDSRLQTAPGVSARRSTTSPPSRERRSQ